MPGKLCLHANASRDAKPQKQGHPVKDQSTGEVPGLTISPRRCALARFFRLPLLPSFPVHRL